EVRDASPLVTVALHRLLLAVLHRNLGPAGTRDWKRLLDAGRFPAGPLADYFQSVKGRFDLFDPGRPFYQDREFRTESPAGINQPVRDLPGGHNAALFAPTFEAPPPLLSPAAAARALVTEQAFAVRGGNSELGYTTSAPLVGGVAVLVRGHNLFETLML